MIKHILTNIRYSLADSRDTHGTERFARVCGIVKENIIQLTKRMVLWPKIALAQAFLEYFGEKLKEDDSLDIYHVSVDIHNTESIYRAYLEVYHYGDMLNFSLAADDNIVIKNDIPTTLYAIISNTFISGFTYGELNSSRKLRLFLRNLKILDDMNYPLKPIIKKFPDITLSIIDEDNYRRKEICFARKYTIARKYAIYLEKYKHTKDAIYTDIMKSVLWKTGQCLAKIIGAVISKLLQFRLMLADTEVLSNEIELNLLNPLEIKFDIIDEINATQISRKKIMIPSLYKEHISVNIHFIRFFVPLCFVRLSSRELRAVVLIARAYFCKKMKKETVIPWLEKYTYEFGIELADMAHALALVTRFGKHFFMCDYMINTKEYWSFQRKYNKKFQKKRKRKK